MQEMNTQMTPHKVNNYVADPIMHLSLEKCAHCSDRYIEQTSAHHPPKSQQIPFFNFFNR